MTTKEALHRFIDELTEEDAADLLDYLSLRADSDQLTDEELERLKAIEERMLQGEYVLMEDLRDELLQQ